MLAKLLGRYKNWHSRSNCSSRGCFRDTEEQRMRGSMECDLSAAWHVGLGAFRTMRCGSRTISSPFRTHHDFQELLFFYMYFNGTCLLVKVFPTAQNGVSHFFKR